MKPDSPAKHNRHNKRNRAVQCAAKTLDDQLIYALLPIADATQSTSSSPTEQPHNNPHDEKTSILHHFNCLPNCHSPLTSPPHICRIFDWFPEG